MLSGSTCSSTMTDSSSGRRYAASVASPSGGNREYLIGRQYGLVASVSAGRISFTRKGRLPGAIIEHHPEARDMVCDQGRCPLQAPASSSIVLCITKYIAEQCNIAQSGVQGYKRKRIYGSF